MLMLLKSVRVSGDASLVTHTYLSLYHIRIKNTTINLSILY
jgi:hypothetical protein